MSKLFLYDYPIEGLTEEPEYEKFVSQSTFFGKTIEKLLKKRNSSKSSDEDSQKILLEKIEFLEKQIEELKKTR